MVAHRGPEFAALLQECIEGLKWAFQTEHDIVVLTASGSGGLESLVANTLSAGQKLLAVSIGYFGDRLTTTARAFGVDVVPVRIDDGQAADPALVADRLASEPDIDTVFVTHNETSTGVLNPVGEIARATRQVRPDVLFLVDGISSVGSVPITPEASGIDVVVAGSQKGWMIPPGLTFVSISPRAWERQQRSTLPRMYFDWQLHMKSARDGSTPWTPAVGLFFALQAALRLMRDEGLAQIFERHERLGQYTRGALADLGLALLADPRYASPTVSTAYLPEDVNSKALLRSLHDQHDVVLAGGQGRLDGKIVRIGHLGWVDQAAIAQAVHALQVELNSARSRSDPAAARR